MYIAGTLCTYKLKIQLRVFWYYWAWKLWRINWHKLSIYFLYSCTVWSASRTTVRMMCSTELAVAVIFILLLIFILIFIFEKRKNHTHIHIFFTLTAVRNVRNVNMNMSMTFRKIETAENVNMNMSQFWMWIWLDSTSLIHIQKLLSVILVWLEIILKSYFFHIFTHIHTHIHTSSHIQYFYSYSPRCARGVYKQCVHGGTHNLSTYTLAQALSKQTCVRTKAFCTYYHASSLHTNIHTNNLA